MKIPSCRAGLSGRRSRHAVLAFVAVAAGSILITSCATPSSSSRSHAPEGIQNWAEPLPGGVATTVAGAQNAAGFAVPTPNDPPAASMANLTQTWVDSHAQQVALVYDQGHVVIALWPWPTYYPDPATRFKQLVSSISATASIGQVNGQSALVIQPGTDSTNANRAWIEFAWNGIDVNISSDNYGTAALLQVADSMSTATPSPSPSASSN